MINKIKRVALKFGESKSGMLNELPSFLLK